MLDSTPGPTPGAMLNIAHGLPDARLVAILSGQDIAIPQFVAQAVLSERQRTRQAAAGMQAQAQMAQQPTSKREELLSQFMNAGGIAGQAPASVANMASGGIVAFSEGGESTGTEEKKALSYGEQMRRVGNVPLEVLKTFVSAPGYGLSNLVDRLSKQTDPPVSPKYREEGRNAPKPPEVEQKAQPDKKEEPYSESGRFSVSGSGMGGGIASRPIDAAKYFPKVAPAPTMPEFSAQNPYKEAAAKTPQDYIREQQALNRELGVQENPRAAYEQELRDQQAGAGKARDDAKLWALFNAGIGAASAGGRNGFQNIALSTRQAAGRYQRDIQELAQLEAERKKALNDIAVANNDVKRGQVESGLKQRDEAQVRANNAAMDIAKIKSQYDTSAGQINAQNYATTTGRDSARSKALLDAEISQREIDARLNAARLSASAAMSRGERTTLEEEVYKQLLAMNKTPEEAYTIIQKLKNPPTGVEALMQNMGVAGGPAKGYDPSKVKQVGN